MRTLSVAVLAFLVAGCGAGPSDLLRADACFYSEQDEVRTNPPVSVRSLHCADLGGHGTAQATFGLDYCPFHPTLQLDALHSFGAVRLRVREGGETVQDETYPPWPLHQVASLRFDDNKPIAVRLDV